MAFLYIMLLRCWFIRDVSQLVSLLEEIGPINWKFILVIVSDNWATFYHWKLIAALLQHFHEKNWKIYGWSARNKTILFKDNHQQFFLLLWEGHLIQVTHAQLHMTF